MQHKTKRLTRRQFITRSAGAMGFLGILSSPLLGALNRAKTGKDLAVGSSQSVSGEEKVRAWCMVIDLKKCEGCVTIDAPPQCLEACIAGHYIPKGQKWLEIYEVELPGKGTYFMPTPCMHCENAPCVNVCPVGATYHTKEGFVLVDQRRCIGCRMCMGACPYQRRFFNWGTPDLPPEAAFAEYSPSYPIGGIKGTVSKCVFCPHMLESGKLPFCVVGCPMKALYMGDLNEDIASNGAEVVELSRFLDKNNAYRYKEELGTQPRVWYLPGHGENFNRKPYDERQLKQATWSWGGDGYSKRPGIWPWGKDL